MIYEAGLAVIAIGAFCAGLWVSFQVSRAIDRRYFQMGLGTPRWAGTAVLGSFLGTTAILLLIAALLS